MNAKKDDAAMIITIDGPAASGKSVAALELAVRMAGYHCLNTGAMYRAVGMLALRAGTLASERDTVALAGRYQLDFDWSAVRPELLIDGTAVARHDLHAPEVAMAASAVARMQGVRDVLIGQQRRIGRDKRMLISEGRDQGSVVFAEAAVKFFLTALVTVRAGRRFIQQIDAWRGPHGADRAIRRPEYFDTLLDLIRRDHQDTTSRHGRLVVPHDAVVIDSTEIDGVDRVVDLMLSSIEAAQR